MWEIYAYQNVQSLSGLFNAIAALSGNNDYKAAIFTVLFLGFLSAMFAYAFAPQKMQGWYWLGSRVLILSVLFVPKSTVMIIDKTSNTAPRAVANVPLGLAVLASVSSKLGNSVPPVPI